MANSTHADQTWSSVDAASEDEIDWPGIRVALRQRWRLIVFGSLLAGVLGWCVAFLMPPVFTARAVILPPAQQQGSAAAALSSLGSLGALAGIAGGGGALKSPADQYVAFMQSETVVDEIVDRFQLQQLYDARYKVDARKALADRSVFVVGKKDGLISIAVDDHDPKRAADLANAYVEGLRTMTRSLAVSEAQQRRLFFEEQLAQTKGRLVAAQVALQSGGIDPDAIKAEPKAAIESYAKLRAEAMAAEVKLQALRKVLVDGAPELLQQQAVATALRAEVDRAERREGLGVSARSGVDYVGKYREFKYQEVLFDMFARQYELAKADEAKEGALVQFVDRARPPERRSKPKRSLVALGCFLVAVIALGAFVVFRRRSEPNGVFAATG